MFKQLLVAAGVWLSQSAVAAEVPEPAPAPAMGGRGPVETVQEKVEEVKSKEELEREARMREVEEANRGKQARVVVLPWEEEEFWQNVNLQNNIKIRIARPDAKFFPDIDLYQAGRKEPDRSLRASDQRAIVPDSAIPEINNAVADISTIPYNAMSPQDWALRASELRDLAEKIWFVDRPELREPMFLLYIQIGRAAENSETGSPPFYEAIGGQTVNYYWYLAGTMAWETPELLAKVNDQELNASVSNYRTMLETGQIPLITMSFALSNRGKRSSSEWDAGAFNGEYTVYLNGVQKTITSDKGLLQWPPGRVDVYMNHGDGSGHSLSDRIEIDKFDQKIYFVRNVARTKMGIDFGRQLLEHPNVCAPQIDGDVVNYLAIYQKLHPLADIYIAIPYAGSTAPNKILLWQWDKERNALFLVEDPTGGFPVRFALLGGTGITFSGAEYVQPTEEDLNNAAIDNAQTTNPSPFNLASTFDNFSLNAQSIPLNVQLRGHYGRLMIPIGMQYSAGLVATDFNNDGNEDYKWRDQFQAWNPQSGPNAHYTVTECRDALVSGGDTPTDAGDDVFESVCGAEVLRERTWQRLVYTGVGAMLGRNAPLGFGYRGYVRVGWYNVPHLVDLTGHLGVTTNPLRKPTGRVNPLVDLDFWGGAGIPYKDSMYVTEGKKTGPASLIFGFQALAGLTF